MKKELEVLNLGFEEDEIESFQLNKLVDSFRNKLNFQIEQSVSKREKKSLSAYKRHHGNFIKFLEYWVFELGNSTFIPKNLERWLEKSLSMKLF